MDAAEETATLVTPPSSSALDTLSFASFRFFEDAVRSSSSSLGLGLGESGEADGSGGAKTLSPPPRPLVRRGGCKFVLGAAQGETSCASSYSSSSSLSSRSSASGSESGARQQQQQRGKMQNQNQMYSLEDLLAQGREASRFSDDEDEEEGERESDLWQTRGRAPRAPAIAAH